MRASSSREHRTLGNALDALVRTARLSDPSFPLVARRVYDVWQGLASPSIEIAPLELRVDKVLAVKAVEQVGRWLLPAFMAGMRTLRMRPEATCDDLMRLAQELSGLSAELEAIKGFRDWLWSDGAQGFDVQLADMIARTPSR